MTKNNGSGETARVLPRRSFLKPPGLASVAAAAVVAVPEREAERSEQTTDASKGYREPDHVRAYSEPAKF